MARGLVGRSHAAAEALLGELGDHHLVAVIDGQVHLHQAVRDFAAARGLDEDPPSARRAALDRAVLAVLPLARAAAAHLRPAEDRTGSTTDGRSAHLWLTRNIECVMSLLTATAGSARSVSVIELAEPTAGWLETVGRYHEAMALDEVILALAGGLSDRAAADRARYRLGRAAVRVSDWGRAEAWLSQARAGFAAARDRIGEGRAIGSLAILHAQTGRLDLADEMFAAGADLAVDLGDDGMLSGALNNRAIVANRRGDSEAALEFHVRALEAAVRAGDRAVEARTLINTAALLAALDRLAEAEHQARLGLAIAEELGLEGEVAHATHGLGTIMAKRGHPEQGILLLEGALESARQQGARNLEAGTLAELALALLAVDRTAEAEAALAGGLELAREIADPLAEGQLLIGRGRLDAARGDLDAAGASYRAAITALEGTGARELEEAAELLASLPTG